MLRLFAMFFAGAVVGATGVFLGSRTNLTEMPAVPAPEAGAVTTFAGRLDEVSLKLDELSVQIQGLAVVRENRVPVQVDSQNLPAEWFDTVEGGDEGKKSASREWIGVLDGEIVRVLLERGLTPFTSGVATHLRTAGEALRKLESDRQLRRRRFSERFHAREISLEDFSTAVDPIDREAKALRAQIVEQFANGLDTLDRPTKSK